MVYWDIPSRKGPAYMGDLATGHDIKQVRQHFGWSKSELARVLHVDRRTVYRWERGEPVPDIVAADVRTLVLVARTWEERTGRRPR